MADLDITQVFDNLTIEEIEQIEEIAGVGIDAFETRGAPKGRILRAVACIVKRRSDPEFTPEAAGKLTVADMEALVESATTPTGAAS